MQSFVPGRATVPASAPTAEPHVEEEARVVPTAAPSDPAADVMAELRALREEVVCLRLIHRQDGNRWDGVAPGIVTAPNSKGELPPPDVRFPMSASFPEDSTKTKGDYNPPQATCWPRVQCSVISGKVTSAMSLLLWDSSEMACLEDGSTNASFSSDFSPSTGLPTVGVECPSYDDILDAIHGLSTLGQDVWYDYMRKLTRLLRVFVSKNKSADPETTPVCVRLTLLYVNKLTGAALAHMQYDDSQWWSGFCESLRAIDYQSPAWTMALVSVLTQEKDIQREARGYGKREQERNPAIPGAIRRLLPINHRGQEPCLLNVAWLSCSGGSRDRCGNSKRTQNWPDPRVQ
ncbi:hypothetical protein PC123_g4681 [Phytophthora cactorum]|nr:hypothetical protein PC123_g4681 [Phytophthora cactorum]